MALLTSIFCEITCSSAAHTDGFAQIIQMCADEVGQPVSIESILVGDSPSLSVTPTVTLYLPVKLVATQDQIWCLACRLACFCPSARVSLLVLATDAFPTAIADNPLLLQTA